MEIRYWKQTMRCETEDFRDGHRGVGLLLKNKNIFMNVTKNGSVRWKSYYWVFITNGLIGKQVGAEEIGNGIWKVFYRDVFLGYFSENDIRVKQKSTRLSTNLV